ncbi:MAG: large subunit ribosomal protein [Candidatus Diapherotrites archaeon]|nr:large subunit ribosomal protein [Candidatus Diapherotrites archaeon]MDN5366941.1 large subunit ribosomal protein [Candidatus Diapherotrites archaeon]
MAHGPRYRVKFRRIREGKTRYTKRLKLIKSGKPRLVVRRTSNNILVQVVEFHPEGDRVLASASSADLKRLGWKGHGGNTPAAYLVGFLAAKRAVAKGVKEAVLDIGFATPVHGSAPFAALKGAIDAGLSVPASESAFPSEERIRGEHIAAYAEALKKENPERYKRQFGAYLKRGLNPEDLPKHFDEILAKVKAE